MAHSTLGVLEKTLIFDAISMLRPVYGNCVDCSPWDDFIVKLGVYIVFRFVVRARLWQGFGSALLAFSFN